jgi:hypothetical protein
VQGHRIPTMLSASSQSPCPASCPSGSSPHQPEKTVSHTAPGPEPGPGRTLQGRLPFELSRELTVSSHPPAGFRVPLPLKIRPDPDFPGPRRVHYTFLTWFMSCLIKHLPQLFPWPLVGRSRTAIRVQSTSLPCPSCLIGRRK